MKVDCITEVMEEKRLEGIIEGMEKERLRIAI